MKANVGDQRTSHSNREPDVQILRDLLALSEMALRDERKLFEELHNGRTADETG